MRSLVSSLMLSLCISAAVTADTLRVPEDYELLISALNAATAGDTVMVSCGTHLGGGELPSGVVLTSESGDPNCAIVQGVGWRILTCLETEPGTRIEGLTFREGLAIGQDIYSYLTNGAAVHCSLATVEITNCVFEDNEAHYGGAVSTYWSDVVFEQCRFAGNVVRSEGGAISAYVGSIDLRDCEFRANSAGGGGALNTWNVSLRATDCLFEANSASFGGALYLGPGVAEFVNCRLRNNVATGQGGAVRTTLWADVTILDSIFARNEATETGATIVGTSSSTTTVRGCSIVGDRAPAGTLLETFSESTITVERSIIAQTTSLAPAGCDGIIFSCTNIYGNSGGDWIGCLAGLDGQNGNFSADPLFCDFAADDFSLREDSPCAPGNHPAGDDCGLIGAFGPSCGTVSIENETWSRIKSQYR